MNVRALAGRLAPRGGEPHMALAAALEREGPASGADAPPFAASWTPPTAAPEAGECICLIEGRPRTERLARTLGLDPAGAPEQILGAGFERLGPEVVERLDGSFALAVWDPRLGRGLLARDRLGNAPLFLAEATGALLFASEVRTLLALMPRRPAPDAVALSRWLAHTRSSDERTLYGGISRLPAAHFVELDREGWGEPRRYWRPRYRAPAAITRGEAVEAVRGGMARAVARSLEGAAAPAVMLSGGLDSAAVAAMAGRPLPAYSGVFPHDPGVDESDRLRGVRERLGLDGVELHFLEGSALRGAAGFIRRWELPSVSPNPFVWSPLLRQAAEDGIDVVVDGEGGDELFGCARFLVADRLFSPRPLSAFRVARRLPGMGERPRPRWIARAILSYGLRAGLPAPVHARLRAARGRGLAGPPWLRPEEDRRHRAQDDPWAWKHTPGPRWWAELAHALTGAGDAMGAPDQLRREARGAGLELRHPLRDPELVELVLGLPPELAFDPLRDRPLARDALAGALPEATLESSEKPTFNSLLGSALEGRDRDAVAALLANPHPELARRVREGAVQDLVAGPRSAATTLAIWRLSSLEMWLRHQEDPAAALDPFTDEGTPDDFSLHRISAPARQLLP